MAAHFLMLNLKSHFTDQAYNASSSFCRLCWTCKEFDDWKLTYILCMWSFLKQRSLWTLLCGMSLVKDFHWDSSSYWNRLKFTLPEKRKSRKAAFPNITCCQLTVLYEVLYIKLWKKKKKKLVNIDAVFIQLLSKVCKKKIQWLMLYKHFGRKLCRER